MEMRELADLPNQEGFRFRGFIPGVGWTDCKVVVDWRGLHTAIREDNGFPCFGDLEGWMPRNDK